MAKTRAGLPVVKDETIRDLKSYKLPFPPGGTVLNDDLDGTCDLYKQYVSTWQFLQAAYDGIDELLRLGILEAHERESAANFRRRQSELYSFGYTKSIVDLFTHYLFQRPVKRTLGPLETDPLWTMFTNDCDLFGARFDDYLTDREREASTVGHVGLLVDKPTSATLTVAEAKKRGVYPYLAAYSATSILDWRYERDEFNRPQLAYLKLKDDDGTYRLWWRDRWETWRKGRDDEGDGNTAVKIGEGVNPLGEIPFVWLYNEFRAPGLGRSDVKDIARIDVAIVRNLSQGEEIINYSAFPMMRKPMERIENTSNDDSGPSAILEFDPEHPESKPDWLSAEVSGPIGAIRDWIAQKIGEIYRASNAGGMAATEINTDAQSGIAIQAQFQLLNAKLVRKAVQLEHAETRVIRLWRMWQGYPSDDDQTVVVERSRKYDVENLSVDLANFMTAQTIVKSQTFDAEVQKTVARRVLPTATDDTLTQIDEEIEAGPVEPSEPEMFNEAQEPESEEEEEATPDEIPGNDEDGETREEAEE